MLKLLERQTLTVINKADQGIYLGEDRYSTDKVLLPKKQVPDGIRVGDELEVFLYLDSKDRMIATVRQPLISLNKVAMLKVAGVTKIGAFVNWGLEKDVLLPYKQQTKKVREGEDVLCALYIDKTGRPCVTMKLYDYIEKGGSYKVGDEVTGRVYEISDNFGAFVAVDNMYSALVPKKEMFGDVKVGEDMKFRVIAVLEDGRYTLACRKNAYLQIDEDAKKVIDVIKQFDGVLPFNDKANPEVIKREFGMSKNEFKRAVGHLYKERMIDITEKSIRLL